MKQAIAILYLLIFLALALFVVHAFVPVKYDSKQDARLEKLEAASTTAQQPFERHNPIPLNHVKYSCSNGIGICTTIPHWFLEARDSATSEFILSLVESKDTLFVNRKIIKYIINE
ncbi:MAG: hypothetical protein WC449_05995 [Candidatus Paceibacterota bacterium]